MNRKYPSNQFSWLSYYVAILGNNKTESMQDDEVIRYKGMVDDGIIGEVHITLGEIKMRAFDELYSILPTNSMDLSKIVNDLTVALTSQHGEDATKTHPAINFFKELSNLLRDIRG